MKPGFLEQEVVGRKLGFLQQEVVGRKLGFLELEVVGKKLGFLQQEVVGRKLGFLEQEVVGRKLDLLEQEVVGRKLGSLKQEVWMHTKGLLLYPVLFVSTVYIVVVRSQLCDHTHIHTTHTHTQHTHTTIDTKENMSLKKLTSTNKLTFCKAHDRGKYVQWICLERNTRTNFLVHLALSNEGLCMYRYYEHKEATTQYITSTLMHSFRDSSSPSLKMCALFNFFWRSVNVSLRSCSMPAAEGLTMIDGAHAGSGTCREWCPHLPNSCLAKVSSEDSVPSLASSALRTVANTSCSCFSLDSQLFRRKRGTKPTHIFSGVTNHTSCIKG